MSYSSARQRFDQAPAEPQAPSTSCPAHGCPNAASVNLGGSWACYHHAKDDGHNWGLITQWINSNWPRSGNWNHPEVVKYQRDASAKRRAVVEKEKADKAMRSTTTE